MRRFGTRRDVIYKVYRQYSNINETHTYSALNT